MIWVYILVGLDKLGCHTKIGQNRPLGRQLKWPLNFSYTTVQTWKTDILGIKRWPLSRRNWNWSKRQRHPLAQQCLRFRADVIMTSFVLFWVVRLRSNKDAQIRIFVIWMLPGHTFRPILTVNLVIHRSCYISLERSLNALYDYVCLVSNSQKSSRSHLINHFKDCLLKNFL